MPAGRPSIIPFPQHIIDEICDRYANGESMDKITADEHIPDHKTVRRALGLDEHFSQAFQRARELSASALEERIYQIAMGTVPEYANVSRVQIDTLKWLAAKRNRAAYGDDKSTGNTINQVNIGNPKDTTMELAAVIEKLNANIPKLVTHTSDTRVIDTEYTTVNSDNT